MNDAFAAIYALPRDELARKVLSLGEHLQGIDGQLVRASAALLHAKDELIAAKTAKVFALNAALAERDSRIAELEAALQAWVAAYPEAAE